MSPRLRLAAAARALVPATQGSLDSLCGLYAIINATRLALWPARVLTRAQQRRLFGSGVEALRTGRMLGPALRHGMTPAVWRRVCRAMLAELEAITGDTVVTMHPTLDLPVTSDGVVFGIKRQLQAGRPVALSLLGRLDHYTVVARHTQTRLILFDSAGHRWVPVTSLGLFMPLDVRPHRIHLDSIAAFELRRDSS